MIHHPDRGSRSLSIRYTECLAEAGIDISAGSVGDSCDNALAESVIGLFRTGVIGFFGPWKSVARVEWGTCNGSSGTIQGGYTAPSATDRRRKWRTPSMQAGTPLTGSHGF